MGYVHNCDACGERYDCAPAFMGEFRESFLKSTPAGGRLSEHYDIGQTVTMCADCSEEVFG